VLKKHEPCSDGLMKKLNPEHSICAILAEIYNLANGLIDYKTCVSKPNENIYEEIKLKCRVATAMAKSMNNKLIDNKIKKTRSLNGKDKRNK